MKLMKQRHIALASAVLVIVALALIGIGGKDEVQETEASPPVLSVSITHVQEEMLPIHVQATGNIVAWQEAIIGAEADGLRLTEVHINVGDTVKRGQMLALFNADIVEAELAEAQASVAQAAAAFMEAETNHQRAKALSESGAISTQHLEQTMVAAMTAKARLEAMQAIEKKQRLHLAQTRILAPSDGIVTSRTATVGAVVPAGQELFRLIEDGRLEWRAVVAISDLNKLAPGQSAKITIHNHESIQGTLRIVSPTIDTQTHTGLAYVDLPADSANKLGSAIRAGSFAQGYFEVSDSLALTLPRRAIMLRDGFNYVMQVGSNSLVTMKKVVVGRQVGGRVEITSGLVASEAVIESGLGFLSEGDSVRVVGESASNIQKAAAPRLANSIVRGQE